MNAILSFARFIWEEFKDRFVYIKHNYRTYLYVLLGFLVLALALILYKNHLFTGIELMFDDNEYQRMVGQRVLVTCLIRSLSVVSIFMLGLISFFVLIIMAGLAYNIPRVILSVQFNITPEFYRAKKKHRITLMGEFGHKFTVVTAILMAIGIIFVAIVVAHQEDPDYVRLLKQVLFGFFGLLIVVLPIGEGVIIRRKVESPDTYRAFLSRDTIRYGLINVFSALFTLFLAKNFMFRWFIDNLIKVHEYVMENLVSIYYPSWLHYNKTFYDVEDPGLTQREVYRLYGIRDNAMDAADKIMGFFYHYQDAIVSGILVLIMLHLITVIVVKSLVLKRPWWYYLPILWKVLNRGALLLIMAYLLMNISNTELVGINRAINLPFLFGLLVSLFYSVIEMDEDIDPEARFGDAQPQDQEPTHEGGN